MKYSILIIFLALHLSVFGQPTKDLVAYISFDSSDVRNETNNPGIMTLGGDNLNFDCGVKGEAVRFGETDNGFFLLGVENILRTFDFTISFYFKPAKNDPKNFVLFSRKSGCDNTNNAFSIRTDPSKRSLSIDINETPIISGSLPSVFLPENSCWYHIAIMRVGNETRLFVNGELFTKINSTNGERVDISNDDEAFIIGSSNCLTSLGGLDDPFLGFIDEFRLYERALNASEIRELYFAPDQIGNGISPTGLKDTIIFLGNAVQAFITNTCVEDLLWSPTDGIIPGEEVFPDPLLEPTQTTTYSLTFKDQFCTATDSIRVTVIDPDSLDCTRAFVPKAFTPNADGLNDTYGINNPFVIKDLRAFEIFDRWGNRVFATDDPFARWDGSYQGQAINAGVYLYKIRFLCKGEELVNTGSVTVVR